jgi:hypothetical protein
MKDWHIKLDFACVVMMALSAVVIIWTVSTGKAAETKPIEADYQPVTVATTEETTEPMTEPTETEAPVVETTESTEATEAPEATETTEAPEVTEPPYTEEELEYMAMVIYQEAGSDSCSNETRLAVGTVVMNRVADPRFPDTIYDVLMQERQYGRFYWTGLVWAERASNPGEAHAVKRAYECAEKILNGYRSFGADVVWQSEFIQGTEIVSFQDGMYFCR